MRLATACWRASAANAAPLMALSLLGSLWDDRSTWSGMAQDVVAMAGAWGAVSLVWAVLAWLLLGRRARRAGVGLSVDALEERQTHLLWPAGPDENLPERIRERLASSDRAFLVLEPAQDELTFRWRPVGRRSDQSVRVSLTFEELAGTVLVDIRGGEHHLGVAGLHKGTAFVALSQIAVTLGLTGGKGRPRERV
ncbi:hypothetical protein [Streptomyces sp. NPDC046909]|uniref:hypothetical protein n=1 Tax=Streptomyces sp. NPDC046909 TaxID=3155617 RepID=UPI0033F0C337